jgi:hypothetical protein
MQARRPRRVTVAISVFVAVMVALVLIVVRGPAKFFEARDVQSDASCTVRHCPAPDDEPGSRIGRKYEEPGR